MTPSGQRARRAGPWSGLGQRLKRNSIVSIHDQLVAYLSEKITDRSLAPGDRIPSENELAQRLDVSRMTVRGAFDTLAYAGLLVRHQGKGTFVAMESSGLIAFIGQTLISGISSELVAELNHVIAERGLSGWQLLVCGAENDPDRQLQYVETLQRHGVRGIVLAPAVLEPYERNEATLRALQRSGIPFVLIERYVRKLECDYVVADDFRAGFLATDHLARLGHRRIALLSGVNMPSIRQRRKGYQGALKKHCLPYDPELVCQWPDHTRELEGARVAVLLERGATAVFCYTDQGAIQITRWCTRQGLRVPDDLAVVGVGDLRIALGPRPILTTVRLDFRGMAERSLDILLGRIEGRINTADPQQVVLGVELVVRESCGASRIACPSAASQKPGAGAVRVSATAG
jgi:GntR family transcriptional regulator of arabinose operon